MAGKVSQKTALLVIILVFLIMLSVGICIWPKDKTAEELIAHQKLERDRLELLEKQKK
jgi:hypothetical protein